MFAARKEKKGMFFGWEINGLAAFIIIIAYIWIKDRRKAKNSDVCEKRHDETRFEMDETTDPHRQGGLRMVERPAVAGLKPRLGYAESGKPVND